MTTRRQHYIWRNYLRAWSTSKDQIWCRRDNKIFPTNLMNIGQERDFYRLKDLTNQEIEIIQILINSNQSEMIKGLNDGWIKLFTSIFQIRDRVNDLGISDADFEEKIEKQVISLGEELHCNIESGSTKFLDGMINDNRNFLIDEENVIGFINYLCVQYFRTKNTKERAIKSVEQIPLLDLNKAWNILSHSLSTTLGWSIYNERSLWSAVILKNNTKVSFLTGDQPIINTYAAFDGKVTEHDDLELYYPLSPQKALLLTKKAEYKGLQFKELNETEVIRYNDSIIDLAYEQIYAETRTQLDEIVG